MILRGGESGIVPDDSSGGTKREPTAPPERRGHEANDRFLTSASRKLTGISSPELAEIIVLTVAATSLQMAACDEERALPRTAAMQPNPPVAFSLQHEMGEVLERVL